MHQAALEWTLTPENWSGRGRGRRRRSTAGSPTSGVARYRQLEGRHLDPRVAADVRARRHRAEGRDPPVEHLRRRGRAHARLPRRRASSRSSAALYQMEDYIQQVLAFDVRRGRAGARREAGGALHVARPRDQRAAGERRQVRRRATPTSTRRSRGHAGAWEELWQVCDIRVPARASACSSCCGCTSAHVLQVCSRHTAHHDAGVPARGLNGEAYRGHVFWDELYVFPFLNFRLPEITRGLLMYRYRRIGEARAAAREAGYRGAMFPWQSGSDGHGGDPARPPQPAVGALGARPQPQPAPRQRGDLLQRLALLPGHPRPRVPARLRRRDDARDRALLGLDRALQPRARALRDPRRDGPGRVPREVPGRDRGRACATTPTPTSWWRGSARRAQAVLDLLPGEPPRGAARRARPRRRGAAARGRT